MANPHDVLGVDRDADEETVKEAYRELVKKHHPDQGGDAEKFHEIRTAYEQIHSGNESRTETTTSATVSITCSDCQKTKTVAKEDITVIRGKRYCEDCYVETSCEQCGESVVDTKQKFHELGESVICSNCTVERQCANCHRSVRVNPRKQNTDDTFYCSDCDVADCRRCGKTVTSTTSGYRNIGRGPVCDDCDGERAASLPGTQYTRRAALGVFGVLTVGVGAKAFQEGYFTGTIGQAEPDFVETEDISITDESYFAERFTLPGNGRLEYELEVESGSLTSRLYTSPEYEKFKQGFDERNTYDQGEQLDRCSVSSHSGSAEFGCDLPGGETYALVLNRASAETVQGVLTYRVFL